MLLGEAKSFVGKICTVRFTDRTGQEQMVVSKIYDATYVPMYGGYLVTDTDDIRLDRVCGLALANETQDAAASECIAA